MTARPRLAVVNRSGAARLPDPVVLFSPVKSYGCAWDLHSNLSIDRMFLYLAVAHSLHLRSGQNLRQRNFGTVNSLLLSPDVHMDT